MDAALAEATSKLAIENAKLQPAKDKVAADVVLLLAAEKALADGSPIYGSAALAMLTALRPVRTANEATVLAKQNADAEAVKTAATLEQALADCKPPPVRCENSEVLAAEAALKPLTEAVEAAKGALEQAKLAEETAVNAAKVALAASTEATGALTALEL